MAESENKKRVKTAVALGYDKGSDLAPKVLASGKGFLAEQILNLAEENNLPVRNDPILAEALAQVDLNQVIPPELYAVVAEVFAFVYRLREKNDGPKNL